MKRNSVSWIVLTLLFGLSMLGLGIRQGMNVGEKNVINKQNYEAEIKKLTPTPTISPTKPVNYKSYTDTSCNISYLLPENVSSEEAKITFFCGVLSASKEAQIKKEGFIPQLLLGGKRVWIKSEKNLIELIRRTMESIN